MSNPFAEYRLYRANFSPFVGIAYGTSKLVGLLKRPMLKAVALTAPFVWLLWSCFLMQEVWSNEVAIYVYSLAVYPDSYEMIQQLGSYYENRNAFDLAEEQYQKAVPLVGKFHGVVNLHPVRLLFRIYVHSRQWDKALKEIEVIERDFSAGQLPTDGYGMYLHMLKVKNDRLRYEEIKKKAQGFYPSEVYPLWTDPETK